jgi:hypothetical protein
VHHEKQGTGIREQGTVGVLRSEGWEHMPGCSKLRTANYEL